MSTRRALVCSFLLLAACEEKVIGSAYEESAPDAGSSSQQNDVVLARYATELAGTWEGPPGTSVKITFTDSKDQPRSGSAVIEAKGLDIFCFLGTCPYDPQAGRPIPPQWEVEYWVLRREGAGVLITLPDPALPISFNCVYLPASSVGAPLLGCGLDGAFVLTPVDAP